jgi:hypothetical protein
MNKHILLLISLVFFLLIACDKKKVEPENGTNTVYDASLEPYIGQWDFSSNTTVHSYQFSFDSLGGLIQTPVTNNSSTPSIGTVSMGRQMGELKIVFNNNYPDNFYYATVLNDQGHLICSGNCETLGSNGLPPFGYHHINDTNYRVDLGYTYTGGSYGTTTTYDITGSPQ